MAGVLEEARGIEGELVDLRRRLHRRPELAWEEHRSAGLAAEYCEKHGLQVVRPVAKTGVMAILNPEKPGPALGFRADLDALPIQEENAVSYRSEEPGKGHLCGHDAHTAMLLGAVRMLAARREELLFPVRFYFQPAEETPPGGAEALLAERRLDGVREIYGLHVNPQLPTGQLGMRAGATMAGMDRFTIRLRGRGGHGAMPHLCLDPIVPAAELILALQTIVARRTDPLEPAVVSVCQVQAGTAFNAIPSECTLVGTARCLSQSLRDNLEGWLRELTEGVAKAHGLTAHLEYLRGTPVLTNDPGAVGKMVRAFKTLGGREFPMPQTLGGEDFAFLLEEGKRPGCLGFLGAGDNTPRTAYPLHHPRFDIDEQALAWGAALFVQLALDQAR
jgi:amidohydrolase